MVVVPLFWTNVASLIPVDTSEQMGHIPWPEVSFLGTDNATSVRINGTSNTQAQTDPKPNRPSDVKSAAVKKFHTLTHKRR